MTNNLSRHEFACQCGCGLDTVDVETLAVIQDVCDYFDCSVYITSGCRCIAHNKAVGGSKNSQHTKCRAGDCKFKINGEDIDPDAIYEYLTDTYDGKYGFGLYDNFVHVDTRTQGPARWVDNGV